MADAETEIIQKRLSANRTTHVAPLTKCAKKFLSLSKSLEIQNNQEDVNQAYQSLLKEISTYEFSANKENTIVNTNSREQQNYNELYTQTAKDIEQAKQDIEKLKAQLEQEKNSKKALRRIRFNS